MPVYVLPICRWRRLSTHAVRFMLFDHKDGLKLSRHDGLLLSLERVNVHATKKNMIWKHARALGIM